MEDSSYSGIGRPWKPWAWPAIYVAAFVAMMLCGTEASPGKQEDLWGTMAFQALAITGIVALIKTWQRGFTIGNALRLLCLLVLVGVLGIATVLSLMQRHSYQGF